MANVFQVESNVQIIDIIKGSIDVAADGTVRFRSRLGRGSGKAIEIPGDQFDAFVEAMIRTREVRQSLVADQNSIVTKE
jgi:hypothetical protein